MAARLTCLGIAVALAVAPLSLAHAAPETPPEDIEAEPEEGETDDGPSVTTDSLVLDPDAAARDNAAGFYEEGSDLYETGKYPEAIEKFERAFELTREVQLLFNIGQAHWKWSDADPDIEHLRQAALFFRNYDKRMRLTEGYDPTEIDNVLKAIDAQIENEERKIAERNRPVIVAPSGPTEDELRWEQRRRTTKALNISGNVTLVLGGLALGMGLAGLATRGAYGAILDNSSGEDAGSPNLASAEEDERNRNGYRLGGQIAFAGLITAAIILPVGIALRVSGAVREKQDRAEAKRRDDERRKLGIDDKKKISLEPTASGIKLRF